MSVVHHEFTIETEQHNQVVDITSEVAAFVAQLSAQHGNADGVCTVYTPHATAAITINENDDPNIGTDFINALKKVVIEHDGWLHDRVDNNAAAHIKAAVVGPSESIPVQGGRLSMGTWQNIFLCDFDGPRSRRRVTVSLVF